MTRRGTVVLMYHRVADHDGDPMRMRVRPEHFADQLDALGRAFELVELAHATSRSRTSRVAVTFDDGYADNAEIAAPMLEARGSPATFFVTSRVLTDPRPFWWDRLESIVLDAPLDRTWLDVTIDQKPFRADMRGATARSRTLDAARRRLEPLRSRRRDSTIDEIAQQLEHAGAAAGSFVTRDHLRALAGSGFEIGAHSVTHPRLDCIDGPSLHREVTESRAALEREVGCAVTSFAYPHGASNPTVEHAVQSAGFTRACAVEQGVAGPRTNVFRIPRVAASDVKGEELCDLVAATLDDRGS